jgi:hypothetical protein
MKNTETFEQTVNTIIKGKESGNQELRNLLLNDPHPIDYYAPKIQKQLIKETLNCLKAPKGSFDKSATYWNTLRTYFENISDPQSNDVIIASCIAFWIKMDVQKSKINNPINRLLSIRNELIELPDNIKEGVIFCIFDGFLCGNENLTNDIFVVIKKRSLDLSKLHDDLSTYLLKHCAIDFVDIDYDSVSPTLSEYSQKKNSLLATKRMTLDAEVLTGESSLSLSHVDELFRSDEKLVALEISDFEEEINFAKDMENNFLKIDSTIHEHYIELCIKLHRMRNQISPSLLVFVNKIVTRHDIYFNKLDSIFEFVDSVITHSGNANVIECVLEFIYDREYIFLFDKSVFEGILECFTQNAREVLAGLWEDPIELMRRYFQVIEYSADLLSSMNGEGANEASFGLVSLAINPSKDWFDKITKIVNYFKKDELKKAMEEKYNQFIITASKYCGVFNIQTSEIEDDFDGMRILFEKSPEEIAKELSDDELQYLNENANTANDSFLQQLCNDIASIHKIDPSKLIDENIDYYEQ